MTLGSIGKLSPVVGPELSKATELQRIVAYYQPLVDAVSSRIVGFEALARLRTGPQSVAPPSAFKHLFGNSVCSRQLDQLMLCLIARQCEKWNEVGIEFSSVSWNVGPHELGSCSIVDSVQEVLFRTKVRAENVTIEVTETAMLGRQYERKLQNLERLREIGCLISLDDFGLAGTSMSQLRDLPYNSIKIAGTFIDAALHSGKDRAIVEATIDLAHTLGARVVAEGVESVRQLNLLRSFGCDTIQGHLFSPAMPAAFVPSFLQCWRDSTA